MKLKAEVNDDGAKKLILQKAGRISAKSKEALEQLGKEEVDITRARIDTGKVTPDGTPWAPWSIATLRERTRTGTTAGGLLHKTGALSQSIKYKLNPNSLVISSDSPYAQYLQNGTSNMPARPFLGWNQEAINNFRERLHQAILQND